MAHKMHKNPPGCSPKAKLLEAGMVVCPQCSVKHNDGEEFCRECGSFLLSIEDPLPEEEKPKVNSLCPRCQVLYQKGSYCPTCGSLLMRGTVPREAGRPLEKKSVKKSSKKWLKLLEEEKELESCISKLEAQRDKISGDVLNLLSLRYKERLESLSPCIKKLRSSLNQSGKGHRKKSMSSKRS